MFCFSLIVTPLCTRWSMLRIQVWDRTWVLSAGEWRHDQRFGHGAYYYVNGDLYEGCWRKGIRHGLGTYWFADTDTKFVGNWVNGKMEGPGQMALPNHRFYGTWNKNLVSTFHSDQPHSTKTENLRRHLAEAKTWKFVFVIQDSACINISSRYSHLIAFRWMKYTGHRWKQ